MTTCPFHHQSPDTAITPTAPTLDLSHLPPNIARLPVRRGFPVPWFVAQVDGEYDFRIMDGQKLVQAVKGNRCWVCGETLGKYRAFVIGPMCGVNRTNPEPPSHLECAQFSARHCPFLTRPHMKRREDSLTEECADNTAGIALLRNPGACAVWVVKDRGFKIFHDRQGRPLFEIGEPERVEWYAEGRAATREEVLESIRTGEPLLREACEQEKDKIEILAAHQELDRRIQDLQRYLP